MDFNKCIMICISHYSTIQNNFTIRNIPSALTLLFPHQFFLISSFYLSFHLIYLFKKPCNWMHSSDWLIFLNGLKANLFIMVHTVLLSGCTTFIGIWEVLGNMCFTHSRLSLENWVNHEQERALFCLISGIC